MGHGALAGTMLAPGLHTIQQRHLRTGATCQPIQRAGRRCAELLHHVSVEIAEDHQSAHLDCLRRCELPHVTRD